MNVNVDTMATTMAVLQTPYMCVRQTQLQGSFEKEVVTVYEVDLHCFIARCTAVLPMDALLVKLYTTWC